MLKATEVEVADVYRGEQLVAKLKRTQDGSQFTYLDSYKGPPIAVNLTKGVTTEGDNLPPFFANLLPEGARLASLIARARTSASDMFSLLLEAGPDCVGDIYAVPEGQIPESTSSASVRSLKDLDFNESLELANSEGRDGSLAGVQDKLSISDSTITIPIKADAVGSAILKLSPSAYPSLVENESFFLGVAQKCGFKVNKSRIVKDRNGQTGLLIARFDRIKSAGKLLRLHQEDGCQLMNQYPADKYRISMADICKRVQIHATAPVPEILELIRRYIFAYLIGNADLHAKNISFYTPERTSVFEQTPLYDIVCTALYPKHITRMAIHVDGKDDRFRMRDFIEFAERFGIPEIALRNTVSKLITKLEPLISQVDQLPYNANDIERTQSLIRTRVSELKQ